MIDKVDISKKFDLITEHFRPKTVTELNGQAFQLAKIKGDYPWHAHPDEDELFFCWKGTFTLDVEGQDSVVVGEGECITVPKGTRHRPRADKECWIFLIEPVGTKNSGDTIVDEKYDAPVGAWV